MARPVALAPGSARGRGRRRILGARSSPSAPTSASSAAATRASGRRCGIAELEPGGVHRARRGGHLRRRPLGPKRRLRPLLVAEGRDARQARGRGGGFPARPRLRRRRSTSWALLRARGHRRALPPRRLALDGDVAGAARLLGGRRRPRRHARASGRFEILSAEEVQRRTGSPVHLGAAFEAGAATVQPALLARGLRRVAARARRADLRALADGRARPRAR